ncbi:DNA repair protein [Xylariaceae sp. FL0662B]|nr:DNA repair protein [Xylariaceae sp. FL0662B]
MAGLSPQVTNIIIILGMMQVSKRIPFDDPNVLNGVRALYIASNLIIAGIYIYVQLQITKKKDLTTLKYVEPAPLGSSEEGKLVTTTVHAYDSQQIKNSFRSQMMGVAMMCFMHLYMKYTNPLLIQSIIPLKSAFESNIVKIHLFGKPASGDLKRPFKQAAGLMGGLQGGPPQSDKKAVEAAERAGRGGEENRLRAKALRDQHEAAARTAGSASSPARTPSGFIATGDIQLPRTRKRAYDAISGVRETPSTSRDGRANGVSPAKDGVADSQGNKDKDGAIKPARNFTKFVDYDFGKMTDTKGGFLSAEDDPWNKAMSGSVASGSAGTNGARPGEERPKDMSVQEWERLQLLKKLRRQKAGPFEPGLSVLTDGAARKKCRECGSLEIDFVWEEVFKCAVCGRCKEKYQEKYSLLTKTECKEDYLLTDPELRDEELLPHLSKPNPRESRWHDMMLFLRYQVEAYAFERKWGSAEALDAEFERREADKKRRKEAKFKDKLLDLKKRTQTDAYRRQQGKFSSGNGGGRGGGGSSSSSSGRKARFGDAVPNGGRHVHEWGRAIENEEGMTVKTCTACGMEVEELEF